MSGFFPHFPFFVPHSPGIPHWWDLFWWAFQLIVMTAILLSLRKVAVSIDQERGDVPVKGPQSSSRPPTVSG
ncbi:MAG: hypothetical protein M0Z53_02810 [Thermaerobacter sp.]|nr:hypothetical protein [Thermaerobacter sp.]